MASLVLALPAAAGAAGMHAVHSKDGVDVLAVGDAGLVHRSLDGGDTYLASTLGTGALRGVAHRALTVLIVGDGGKVYRSADNGGSWSESVPAGSGDLFAVAMPSDLVAYAAGAGGTLLKSTNAGASWTPLSSGTSADLLALAFSDDDHGWAVGTAGTALETANGGATWTPVATGTANDLFDIAVAGNRVWVVGAYGTARQSTDGGQNWSAVNLRLDARSHVRGVHLAGADSVVLVGGGGFIRVSDDDGATWTFPEHTLQAAASDVHVVGDRWWVSSDAASVVMHSTDGAATWSFPTGTSIARSWVGKLDTGVAERGNTFWLNPQNPFTIYCMLGSQVYVSRDEGDTWQAQGNPEGASQANAFIVSPKDSNLFLAVVDGVGVDRVVRSDDGGQTWSTSLAMPYGEYGIPLEMDPDHPDTLFFGPENEPLRRTTDFGQTWSIYSTTFFRSPCDIVVVPESDSSVILVGDGVTDFGLGDLWRATGGSTTFTRQYQGGTGSSEIPTISSSRLRNNAIFLTSWSAPAPHVSNDYGLTWSTVGALSAATSTWGTDIARDDPNCVIIGQFGGIRQTYLSFDGGTNYSQITNIGSNYAYYMRDRAFVLQLQSTGIYKLNVSYTYAPGGAQTVSVTSPNGGEIWQAGDTHAITWNAGNVALAVIEYRTGPLEPWLEIAQVPGYVGSYDWSVPASATSEARVRVRDAWDSSPEDLSDADFTILVPAALALTAPLGGETWQYGEARLVEWTSASIESVAIDYSTEAVGGWIGLTGSFPADSAAFTWIIPNDASTTARVRIREVNGTLADSSSGVFEIAVPLLDVWPTTLYVGNALVGGSITRRVSLFNPGSAPVTVSSATSNDPEVTLDKASVVVADSSLGDSLMVTYAPTELGPDTAMVTLVTDDPESPHTVVVIGEGVTSVDVAPDVPLAFALGQNRPNPFSQTTRIDYTIPVRAAVTLEVFDLQGKRVASLVDAVQEPGRYSVMFGRGMPSPPAGRLHAGVYFYRLRAGAFAATRKLLLLP